jgi:Glycosyl hydrolase-like 10
MSASARRPILSAVTLVVVSVVLYSVQPSARDEVRALWVARTSLSSPQAIDSMVAAAQQSGFNALLVEVRGRGDSYFLNGIEPRPSALATLPTFDPLAVAIAKAHARGLALHAWINVNLVAGTTVPGDRTHIVYKHPEWLMVSRQIADDLTALDPTGPEYLGRLTRYARGHRDLDGLYLSPGTASAVEYTTAVIRDIASRYAVDGVHFEDARYPGDDFDYSRETLAAFRKTLRRAAPAQSPALPGVVSRSLARVPHRAAHRVGDGVARRRQERAARRIRQHRGHTAAGGSQSALSAGLDALARRRTRRRRVPESIHDGRRHVRVATRRCAGRRWTPSAVGRYWRASSLARTDA